MQVVTFQLNGISEEQYLTHVEEVAPAFAAMPGLIAKVWLADAVTNTYGGIYTWESRAAMEAYQAGEIFQGLLANPVLNSVTSRDYPVIEAATRLTRGLDRIVSVL
jgi:hypothetical protein